MNHDHIDQLIAAALAAIEKSESSGALNGVRITYMGKNGEVTRLLKEMKTLPAEERPEFGKLVNRAKIAIEEALTAKQSALAGEKIAEAARAESIDITLPTSSASLGHLHPLTLVRRRLKQIFISMGFEIVDGPEIETDYYNFEALHIPKEHPARDMWDTFWIKNLAASAAHGKEEVVLRTHTSNMQIRTMESRRPPVRAAVLGRCYRNEATDATHENVLNQIECFVVDTDIQVPHLIATIEQFLQALFRKKVTIRLRPSYFPFTEPSFEVDMRCLICGGTGCKSCKHLGWLEILGAGMIHPDVFTHVGYNPRKVSGFAFGCGIDRLAMMKYGIDEVRLFNSGDIRLSQQF